MRGVRDFIPQEIFTEAHFLVEKVEQLVRWGLLLKGNDRKKEEFCYVNEDSQVTLRSSSDGFLTVDSDRGITGLYDVQNVARNRGKTHAVHRLSACVCCVIEDGRKKNWACDHFLSQITVLLVVASK